MTERRGFLTLRSNLLSRVSEPLFSIVSTSQCSDSARPFTVFKQLRGDNNNQDNCVRAVHNGRTAVTSIKPVTGELYRARFPRHRGFNSCYLTRICHQRRSGAISYWQPSVSCFSAATLPRLKDCCPEYLTNHLNRINSSC